MLTYRQVETALARLHGADETTQQGAFRGRIKHLQHLGIPLGLKPGRGKRIEYGPEEIWQWAFCLELAEFGIDPKAIVSAVQARWEDYLLRGIRKAAAQTDPNEDSYLMLTVQLMAAAWDSHPTIGGMETIGWIAEKDLGSKLAHTLSTQRSHRAFVINVSNLLRKLQKELDRVAD